MSIALSKWGECMTIGIDGNKLEFDFAGYEAALWAKSMLMLPWMERW